MISAIDTSVLLDLLVPDASGAAASERTLKEALSAGGVVLSEAVYAELSGQFETPTELNQTLNALGIQLQWSSRDTLHRAGTAWRDYSRRRPTSLACAACGTTQAVMCGNCGAAVTSRQHLITDFLIGAHALMHADRLLTRDRGYYRTYFPELRLVYGSNAGPA
jgi:predicted nucleic acid-binding protein